MDRDLTGADDRMVVVVHRLGTAGRLMVVVVRCPGYWFGRKGTCPHCLTLDSP